MKKWFSIRHNFFWIVVMAIAALCFAAYLQYDLGLMPCPLCQLQRMALGSAGLFAFFAWTHNPKAKGIRIYSYIIIGFCIIGASLAARQIYVQHLPPQTNLINTCGVGIDFLFKSRPFFEALKMSVQGTGACAEVNWRLLGLSIAEWTCIAFIVLAVIAMIQIRRTRHMK